MEPNVSLILCKIILFTQFKLKTGSYEPMKTITKSCYGQNEGFRNKYTNNYKRVKCFQFSPKTKMSWKTLNHRTY